MKKYQYILLDWDGTLAKTLDIWLAALRATLEKRGIFLSDEEIGANFTSFKERMEQRGLSGIDAMVEEADAAATQEVPSVELYPDALKVLDMLRIGGKRLALITTSRHDQIDPLLEKYNMRALFDVVVCGDDVLQHKPSAEPIQKALKLLDADGERAIMIGDSTSDIHAANNAGIDSVLFYPPEHMKFYDIIVLKDAAPTYIINDFREVVTIAN